MKVSLYLECDQCICSESVTYVDDIENCDEIIFASPLSAYISSGWQMGETILCPVCTGKMTEAEFIEKEPVEITIKTIE